MDRRRFLASGLTLALGNLAPRAAAADARSVGLLWVSSPASQRHIAFLRETLASKGFSADAARIDADSLVDRYEALEDAARKLVARGPDVVVTYGATAPGALQRVSNRIPVVMLIGSDPVKQGFARSFSHPGGNHTGLWLVSTDSGGKRLELLQRLVPGLKRAAYFYNDESPVEVKSAPIIIGSAKSIGFELEPMPIRHVTDIERVVTSAAKSGVQGLYFASSTMFVSYARQIVEAVNRTRLPTMYPNSEFTEAGGLLSYGANVPGAFRLAGDYVARILQGAKPAEMPIEQYTKFELVVNTASARAQGITIPQSVLGLADRTIES